MKSCLSTQQEFLGRAGRVYEDMTLDMLGTRPAASISCGTARYVKRARETNLRALEVMCPQLFMCETYVKVLFTKQEYLLNRYILAPEYFRQRGGVIKGWGADKLRNKSEP